MMSTVGQILQSKATFNLRLYSQPPVIQKGRGRLICLIATQCLPTHLKGKWHQLRGRVAWFIVVLPLLESSQNPPGSSQGVILMTQALPAFAYSGKLLSSFPVSHPQTASDRSSLAWQKGWVYCLNTHWPGKERRRPCDGGGLGRRGAQVQSLAGWD